MQQMDLNTPLNDAEDSNIDGDPAQEKKALCVSIASLVLSVPALIGA